MLAAALVSISAIAFSFASSKASREGGREIEGITKLTGAGRRLAKLTVEREGLLELISHIYRAEAEGRITKADREEVVKKYAKEVEKLDAEAKELEKVAKLEILERSRQELMAMVAERIRALEKELGMLKKAIPSPSKRPPTKAPSPQKREEYKKLEEIRKEAERLASEASEVLRDLEELG